MWPEDFSFCRRTVFWWGFVGLRRISFRQWFLILCGLKISASAVELCSGEDLWVCRESVFVNDFWFCSCLCGLKISASAVELCSGEDLRVCCESVFVNYFWFCSSLCGLKISASAVEPCSGEDCGSAANQFSWMISYSAVVYVAWRFQLLP
jgi:hypothetical protein